MLLRIRPALILPALAISFALFVPQRSVLADDPPAGEDGAKDGEKKEGDDDGGAPAARFEMPTMDGAVEQMDGRRNLAVRVPKTWKVPEGFEAKGDQVGAWVGPTSTDDMGFVTLSVVRRYSRAQALMASELEGETPDPAETKSAPGVCSSVSRGTFRGHPVTIWRRIFEKDGICYSAMLLAGERAAAGFRPVAAAMLDSFRVVAPVAKPAPAKGVTVKKVGAADMWTDAEDAGKAQKAAELVLEGRAVLEKALKGKPADESRPVVRVWSDGSKYVDETSAVGSPDYGAFDPESRAVLVQLFAVGKDDAPSALRDRGASQYILQYFGGPAPAWIETGLRWYASATAEAGGKADKPESFRTDAVRKACAARSGGFDRWLDEKAEAPTTEDAGYEIYAWHVFFRHGPGKKYGKAYQASIDAFRATGSRADARKAWEGSDFARMEQEFREWASKWGK